MSNRSVKRKRRAAFRRALTFVFGALSVVQGTADSGETSLPSNDPRGAYAEARAESLELRGEIRPALAHYIHATVAAARDARQRPVPIAWARAAWLAEKSLDLARELHDDDAFHTVARVTATAPPSLCTRVAWRTAQHHLRRERYAEAREAVGPLAFPLHWRVAGPFGLEGDGGFDAALGPEQPGAADDPRRTFDGAFGRVGWRDVSVDNDPLGRLAPASHFATREASTAYAAVFVHADEPVDLLAYPGVTGAFTVWLNDGRVATRPQGRGTDAPFDGAVPLRLRPGRNGLVIKIARPAVIASDASPALDLPGVSFDGDDARDGVLALRLVHLDGRPYSAWLPPPGTAADNTPRSDPRAQADGSPAGPAIPIDVDPVAPPPRPNHAAGIDMAIDVNAVAEAPRLKDASGDRASTINDHEEEDRRAGAISSRSTSASTPSAFQRAGDDPLRILREHTAREPRDGRAAYYRGSLIRLYGLHGPTDADRPGDGTGEALSALRAALAVAPENAAYRVEFVRAALHAVRRALPGDAPADGTLRALRDALDPLLEAPSARNEGGRAAVLAHQYAAQADLEFAGRPERALHHARAACDLNPSAFAPRRLVAVALARLGRPAEADAEEADGLRLFPDRAAAHRSVARRADREGRAVDAVAAWTAAHRLDATGESRVRLADALERAGRPDEALVLWRRRLDAYPDDPTAHAGIDGLLARHASPQARWAAIAQALESDEAEATGPLRATVPPDLALRYGDALWTLGRVDDARRAWRNAARHASAAAPASARLDATGDPDRDLPPHTRIDDLSAWVRDLDNGSASARLPTASRHDTPSARSTPVSSSGRAPAPSDEPTASSPGFTYLLYELDQDVDGPVRRATWHGVARVHSPDGARALARERVDFGADTIGRLRLLRVLRPDGRVHSPHPPRRTWARGETIRFLPPPTPGDVVEWVVEIERRLPDEFAGHLGARFPFPQDAPARHVTFSLTVPETMQPVWRSLHGAPEPVLRPAPPGRVRRAWTLDHVPPRPDGPGHALPQIQAGSFEHWDDFAQWYARLLAPRVDAPPEIKRLAAAVAHGRDDPVEQLEAAHDWVVRHFLPDRERPGLHGFRPQPVATILARRHADCKDRSLLLCLLAREYGFDAAPTLVHALEAHETGRAPENFALPMIDHFNHCIARVIVDGRPVALDATARHRLAGELPYPIAGAMALAVTPQGAEWIRLADPGAHAAVWREESTIALDADGLLAWRQQGQGGERVAAHLRAHLASPAGQTACRRGFVAALAGTVDDDNHGRLTFVDHGPDGVELTRSAATDARADGFRPVRRNIGIPPHDDGESPIRLRLNAPPLPFAQHTDDPLPARWTRLDHDAPPHGDLLLPHGYTVERTFRFAWPPGWAPAPWPADVEQATPFGVLRATRAVSSGGAIVRYELSITATRVPSAERDAFRAFLRDAGRLADASFELVRAP